MKPWSLVKLQQFQKNKLAIWPIWPPPKKKKSSPLAIVLKINSLGWEVAAKGSLDKWLVGGWTNPSEKYDRQIGSFPAIFGLKLGPNISLQTNTETKPQHKKFLSWKPRKIEKNTAMHNALSPPILQKVNRKKHGEKKTYGAGLVE